MRRPFSSTQSTPSLSHLGAPAFIHSSKKRSCTSARQTMPARSRWLRLPSGTPTAQGTPSLPLLSSDSGGFQPASLASDPTLNAAPPFACPHRRLPEGFRPAIAGCWKREPLPPRLARPNQKSVCTPSRATREPHAGARPAVFEKWRPQRDSNPRYRRERAMSWAGLDDGVSQKTGRL